MCTSCKRLLPLATTGDGNCLLHAASLGRSSNTVIHSETLAQVMFYFSPFFSSEKNKFIWTRRGSRNSSLLKDIVKRVPLSTSELQKEPVSLMFSKDLRDLNTVVPQTPLFPVLGTAYFKI